MNRCLPLLLVLFLCTCGPAPEKEAEKSSVNTLTISNLEPRLTIDGKIVDAHDGRIIEFEGQYYWYGTQYGTTNGFTHANVYHIYRSDDLVTWDHLGQALTDPPAGVHYRPHVIYNEATKKYVFWYNWYPTLWDGHFGVATADSPAGPFTILDTDVKVARSELGVGDFGLFVDDDQTAYISYNTIEGHRVSVEKLSDDYLTSTLENGGYIAQYCEAGSMFKREGLYYLLTDYTCCFCNQGAGARVYTSDDPLGDWTLTNNINRYPGWRKPALRDGISFTTEYVPLKRMADSTFESLVLDMDDDGLHIDLSFFTGNRSGQCGQVDIPDVHQRIVRPTFTAEYYANGWKPLPLELLEIRQRNMVETIALKTGGDFYPGRIRLTPDPSFPYAEVRLTEVEGSIDAAYVSNRRPGPVIIPAQQTYVMELSTANGTEYIWMGDMWGSASDNVKGHDFQYWSSPLRFDSLGWIAPLELEGEWEVAL